MYLVQREIVLTVKLDVTVTITLGIPATLRHKVTWIPQNHSINSGSFLHVRSKVLGSLSLSSM